MSYILEALKRSQQERELGQTPTLASASYLGARSSSLSKFWLAIALLLALTALLLSLYAAFSQYRNALPAAAPIVAPTPPPAQPSALPPKPRPAPKQGSPASSPQPTATTTTIPAQPQPSKSTPEEPHSELLADIEQFKQRMLNDSLTQNRPSPALTRTQPVSTTPTATSDDDGAQTPTAAPRLRELPRPLQQSIPEHALSVHVYTTDPARRFVIINSSRLHEGDALANGLTLEAIQPDGVILSFAGKRFFQRR
jgi:general secretion pathway protein B